MVIEIVHDMIDFVSQLNHKYMNRRIAVITGGYMTNLEHEVDWII